MKALLIPVDGSSASLNAVKLGGRLAKAMDLTLLLVHVMEPELLPTDDATVFRVPEGVRRANGLAILEAAAESVSDLRVPIEQRLESGMPVEQILAQAASPEVDMIIVGRHGHGAISRLVLGSVSETIMRRADKPVVMTR